MRLVILMMRLIFRILLTNTQVSRIHKAFPNGSSTNIKYSKTQLSNMVQLGGFPGRRLEPVLKTSLPLMANVFKPLAKSVLVFSNRCNY